MNNNNEPMTTEQAEYRITLLMHRSALLKRELDEARASVVVLERERDAVEEEWSYVAKFFDAARTDLPLYQERKPEQMNDKPMTAEQRVRERMLAELYDDDYGDRDGGGGPALICVEVAATIAEAHAAAVVEDAEKRIAELERERNRDRLEIMRLQQCRSALDCTYAGAYGESDGASHCPPERPCQRCTLEREQDEARERLSDQIARSWNAGFRRAQNAKNALSRRDWVAFMLESAKPGTTLEVPRGIDDVKGGE